MGGCSIYCNPQSKSSKRRKLCWSFKYPRKKINWKWESQLCTFTAHKKVKKTRLFKTSFRRIDVISGFKTRLVQHNKTIGQFWTLWLSWFLSSLCFLVIIIIIKEVKIVKIEIVEIFKKLFSWNSKTLKLKIVKNWKIWHQK
jgi:hypothetical protein